MGRLPGTSRTRWRTPALLALAVAALSALIDQTALGDRISRNVGLPLLYLLRGPAEPPPRAIIVAIDRDSTDWLANNAHDLRAASSRLAECEGADFGALNARVGDVRLRAIYACIARRLHDMGAEALVLDVLFHRANLLDGGRSDALLAEALETSGRAVLLRRIDVLTADDGAVLGVREERPTQVLAEAAAAVGHFETPDHGGVISGYIARVPGFEAAPALPEAAHRIVAGSQEAADDCAAAPCMRHFWLYGPPGTIPTFTLAEVMGDDALRRPPERLEGTTAFIGYADPDLPGAQDHFGNPFLFSEGGMPGVELTATAFLNLLEDGPLKRPGDLPRALILGLAAAAMVMAATATRSRGGLAALLIFAGLYLWLAAALFEHARYWLPVGLALSVALPLAVYLWLATRFGLVRRLVDRMAPPDWVERMIAGDGGGPVAEIADAAILVTDLASSTRVAEALGSARFEGFLRAYHEIENACVEAEMGFVDKFTGDGALAVFMRPPHEAAQRRGRREPLDPALRACAAALRIAASVETHNRVERAAGRPTSRMRIALDAGPVAIGQIGGGGRLSFDVVGDPVNTASKLQTLGKEIAPEAEVTILATRAVRELVRARGARGLPGMSLEFEDCGSHPLQGRAAPAEVFRVRGRLLGAGARGDVTDR